jgi:antitoxin component YwqK of YwqJK toxin-antitoxin module
VQYAQILGFSAFLLLSGTQPAYAQTPANGKYVARSANGTLIETGYYTNSQKDKRWAYYNEKGIIDHKEKWDKGELQWQIFYNEKGKITRTIDKKGKETVRPACGC